MCPCAVDEPRALPLSHQGIRAEQGIQSTSEIKYFVFRSAIAWQAVWRVWSSWGRTRTRESVDKNLSGLPSTTQWTPIFQWLKRCGFGFVFLFYHRAGMFVSTLIWPGWSMPRTPGLWFHACQPSCDSAIWQIQLSPCPHPGKGVAHEMSNIPITAERWKADVKNLGFWSKQTYE